MKTFYIKINSSVSLLLIACSAGQSGGSQICSETMSVLTATTSEAERVDSGRVGLLMIQHYDLKESNLKEPMPQTEISSQCNAALELLEESPPKVRLWTASHCIKPLTLTSLKLAVRDESSPSGSFNIWQIDHPILHQAAKMRRAYDVFAGGARTAERYRLFKAFDRRSMLVEGSSAVLTPRVSCENLRRSQQADERHSLCFSIFDLMNLDFELPDPNSAQSERLISDLKKSKVSSATKEAIQHKRETFLRRIHTTSQIEWIIHEGFMLRTFVTSEPLNRFPYFSDDAMEIERLNREVFSLPHPEEFELLQSRTLTTQDAVPPAVNKTYTALVNGRYTSPRVSFDFALTCYRALRRYNPDTGNVDVLPELEIRPHEFCPGGSQYDPSHFWDRDRPWSWMMADMTHEGARQYSRAISDVASLTTDSNERLKRFEVASTFGVAANIEFESMMTDVATPLLKHLRISSEFLTEEIFGLSNLEETGAFLLSMPRLNARARFLKGDSGSIVLLDGVPIATLYSVDGEETSGGSGLLPLPELTEDEQVMPVEDGAGAPLKRGEAPGKGC